MTKKLILRIYRNKKRDFAWTLIGGNGEKLCSGEGYKRRVDMNSTIVLVFLGRSLACGSKSLNTVLAFRDDFQVEDLTTTTTTKGTKCKSKRGCATTR